MYFAGGFTFHYETLLIIFGAIFFGWYLYFRHCAAYWKRKGVPTFSPSFPTGNLGAPLLGFVNLYVHIESLYRKFKEAGHKHGGIYFLNGPVYLPVDPALIKQILINDFEHFTDRGVAHDEEKFPLTANIFCQPGQRWKQLRSKFSPSFTLGKLKTMYATVFVKNAVELIKVLEPIARDGGEISTKKYLNMFTADIIASSALGFQFDILHNPDQEITTILKGITSRPLRVKLKTFLTDGFSKPGNFFRSAFDNREAQQYFEPVIKQTMKFRKDNGIVADDFLAALMKLDGLTSTDILGQTYTIFAAGYDTSSTVMTNCLHLLAYHQDVQDRLRQEIHTNLGQDLEQFTYDKLVQLGYLDKVLKETMRLLPPVAVLLRECVKEYPVPGTNVVIEKGIQLLISILGLHRNPEYFPDPLSFNPDRFDEECIPFTYLPFGEGQRMCIGMRYGQLQAKLGVASIISKFRVLPSKKTPREPEFERIPSSALLLLDSDCFVRLEAL